MVERTAHRIADNETFRQRPAVMRAGRADRENLFAAADKDHGFVADMTEPHGAFGEVVERNAFSKIRATWLVLIAHDASLALNNAYSRASVRLRQDWRGEAPLLKPRTSPFRPRHGPGHRRNYRAQYWRRGGARRPVRSPPT